MVSAEIISSSDDSLLQRSFSSQSVGYNGDKTNQHQPEKNKKLRQQNQTNRGSVTTLGQAILT